jgi:7-carboxy-7-deazaguanine synthase
MIPKAGKIFTPAQYGAVAPSGDNWPLNAHDKSMYAINRVYPTVQGEGGQAGTPMTIVRLQGCPVGCVFCDTPESWALPGESWKHAAEVAAIARQYSPNWALITGGEPCWYDLDQLTFMLQHVKMKCALETSGVYPITGTWDYVTISPKPEGKLPLLVSNIYSANELKWVIGSKHDIRYVEGKYEEWRHLEGIRFSLQPMSAKEGPTKLCLDALMQHPEWRLSLQQHKFLDIA